MGLYDQCARHAAQADSQTFFKRLLRDYNIRLEFDSWIDSRTTPRPGDKDRTADQVAILKNLDNPREPRLGLIEFQAEHDEHKLDVMLEEVGRLRLEKRHGEDGKGKFVVVTGLVYLKGKCPEERLDMLNPQPQQTTDPQSPAKPTEERRGVLLAPEIWNVSEDSASDTLDAIASGVLGGERYTGSR